MKRGDSTMPNCGGSSISPVEGAWRKIAVIADLASAERAMKQRAALRQEGISRSYCSEGQRPFLLLVSQHAAESTGLAIFDPEISRLPPRRAPAGAF